MWLFLNFLTAKGKGKAPVNPLPVRFRPHLRSCGPRGALSRGPVFLAPHETSHKRTLTVKAPAANAVAATTVKVSRTSPLRSVEVNMQAPSDSADPKTKKRPRFPLDAIRSLADYVPQTDLRRQMLFLTQGEGMSQRVAVSMFWGCGPIIRSRAEARAESPVFNVSLFTDHAWAVRTVPTS